MFTMSNSPANSEWRIANRKPRCSYSLFTIPYSRFLVPATHLRPGFEPFLCHPTRGGGAPRRRSGAAAPAACRSASKTRVNALLRGTPVASLSGRTRASRRSTVAILGRGPCFHLRHFLRIRAASSSRPGRSAWRTGSRTSRGFGYEPPPRDRRVGEDVATLTPHRPGRADFLHPVLHGRGSLSVASRWIILVIDHPSDDAIRHSLVEEHLASPAIHCRFVDRFAGFIVPSCVSRQWLSPRDASLSSFGSRRARFPALSGTMKALRLPTRVSMVAYWFASTAHGYLLVRVSPWRSWNVGGPFQARASCSAGGPFSSLLIRGREWDLSGLQAILPVPLLRSRTPLEPACPRHLRSRRCCPRCVDGEGFGNG